MKVFVPFSLAAVCTAALVHAAPADEVAAAALKLNDAASYAWTRTETILRPPAPAGTKITEGVTGKDGFTVSKLRVKGVVQEERVYKGDRYVMLRPDGAWRTPEEMSEKYFGGRNEIIVRGTRGELAVPVASNPEANAASAPIAPTNHDVREIVALLGEVKDLRLVEGVFTGDLTPEALVRRLRLTGRDGKPATLSRPAIGSVKFWVQDGVVAKYQIHLKGSFEGLPGPALERTLTTEIKQVGTATVEVPVAARARFGS